MCLYLWNVTNCGDSLITWNHYLQTSPMDWRQNVHFATTVHKVKLTDEQQALKAIVGSPRQIHITY